MTDAVTALKTAIEALPAPASTFTVFSEVQKTPRPASGKGANRFWFVFDQAAEHSFSGASDSDRTETVTIGMIVYWPMADGLDVGPDAVRQLWDTLFAQPVPDNLTVTSGGRTYEVRSPLMYERPDPAREGLAHQTRWSNEYQHRIDVRLTLREV